MCKLKNIPGAKNPRQDMFSITPEVGDVGTRQLLGDMIYLKNCIVYPKTFSDKDGKGISSSPCQNTSKEILFKIDHLQGKQCLGYAVSENNEVVIRFLKFFPFSCNSWELETQERQNNPRCCKILFNKSVVEGKKKAVRLCAQYFATG